MTSGIARLFSACLAVFIAQACICKAFSQESVPADFDRIMQELHIDSDSVREHAYGALTERILYDSGFKQGLQSTKDSAFTSDTERIYARLLCDTNTRNTAAFLVHSQHQSPAVRWLVLRMALTANSDILFSANHRNTYESLVDNGLSDTNLSIRLLTMRNLLAHYSDRKLSASQEEQLHDLASDLDTRTLAVTCLAGCKGSKAKDARLKSLFLGSTSEDRRSILSGAQLRHAFAASLVEHIPHIYASDTDEFRQLANEVLCQHPGYARQIIPVALNSPSTSVQTSSVQLATACNLSEDDIRALIVPLIRKPSPQLQMTILRYLERTDKAADHLADVNWIVNNSRDLSVVVKAVSIVPRNVEGLKCLTDWSRSTNDTTCCQAMRRLLELEDLQSLIIFRENQQHPSPRVRLVATECDKLMTRKLARPR